MDKHTMLSEDLIEAIITERLERAIAEAYAELMDLAPEASSLEQQALWRETLGRAMANAYRQGLQEGGTRLCDVLAV